MPLRWCPPFDAWHTSSTKRASQSYAYTLYIAHICAFGMPCWKCREYIVDAKCFWPAPYVCRMCGVHIHTCVTFPRSSWHLPHRFHTPHVCSGRNITRRTCSDLSLPSSDSMAASSLVPCRRGNQILNGLNLSPNYAKLPLDACSTEGRQNKRTHILYTVWKPLRITPWRIGKKKGRLEILLQLRSTECWRGTYTGRKINLIAD